MIGLSMLLLGAAVAQALARLLGIPSTPFLLLAGFVLGRLGLLPPEILQEALVLGLTFLLFVLGIELNPGRLRTQEHRITALKVGVLQFTVLGLAGVVAALAIGFTSMAAAYTGVALAASSTLVVVRLLQRTGRLFEPFGRLVVGVLLVQDALVILAMPVVTRAPEGVTSIVIGLLGTAAMLALAMAVARWVAPRFARLERDEEMLLMLALAVPFVFIGLADRLALPLAAGAFVGGVALSPFPTSGLIRAQLTSVGDFFAPVFFLALGGLVMAPDATLVFKALALSVVVLLITPLLVTYLAERAGYEARPAVESGLVLSQTSELSLVVGLHALLVGQIQQDVFTVLALVTVITMVATPYLMAERTIHAVLRLHPLRREQVPADPLAGHVLLLGCGSGGMPLLETLIMSGHDVVAVDDDPEIVTRLLRADILCIHGDASDPDVLRRAGADQAVVVSSTIRRPRDNERVLELLPDRPVVIRVFEDEDADWVRAQGGIPVVYSDAAADEFARWFEEFRRGTERRDT